MHINIHKFALFQATGAAFWIRSIEELWIERRICCRWKAVEVWILYTSWRWSETRFMYLDRIYVQENGNRYHSVQKNVFLGSISNKMRQKLCRGSNWVRGGCFISRNQALAKRDICHFVYKTIHCRPARRPGWQQWSSPW